MDRDIDSPMIGDAFGEALLARLRGEPAQIIYERDDGFIDSDTFDYFSDGLDEWVTERVRGRVLDVGCGGGRACLAIQASGGEVVGLDVSPGALEASRLRGVRQTFLGTVADLADASSDFFDTFLMLGNNIGLIGSPDGAARTFDALTKLAAPGARIVGTCLDPEADDPPPWHASYHQRNREAGRLPGHIGLRTRFRRLATDWFELLWVSPSDLTQIASRSGWRLTEATEGVIYRAVLEQV